MALGCEELSSSSTFPRLARRRDIVCIACCHYASSYSMILGVWSLRQYAVSGSVHAQRTPQATLAYCHRFCRSYGTLPSTPRVVHFWLKRSSAREDPIQYWVGILPPARDLIPKTVHGHIIRMRTVAVAVECARNSLFDGCRNEKLWLPSSPIASAIPGFFDRSILTVIDWLSSPLKMIRRLLRGIDLSVPTRSSKAVSI